MDTPGGSITFEGFVFEPATGDLRRPAGDDTRLPPKPARMLALLLDRPGELLARDELVEELWPGQHLDVDQALAYTVRQVRVALDDEADDPRFVETLPRRGYRFVGRLGESGPPDGVSAETHVRRAPRRAAVAIAVLLLAAAAVAWLWLGRPEGPAPAPGPTRVALLPLTPPERLATDDDALATNERLGQALLVALTARPELDVVGPATTAALDDLRRPQTEIGRELGVAFVVSGGYAPDEKILFLQMVRTTDGGHLFAQRIDGTEDEVADRLGEVAAAMVATADDSAVNHPPR